MLNKCIFGLFVVLMLLSCGSEARRLKNRYQSSEQGLLTGHEELSSLLQRGTSEIPKPESKQVRPSSPEDPDFVVPNYPNRGWAPPPSLSEIPKPESKQVRPSSPEDPDFVVPNYPNRGWAPPPSFLEERSNMEDFMAKWDVSGTQGLGDSCSFWSAKWCQVGLRCSSGTCVRD